MVITNRTKKFIAGTVAAVMMSTMCCGALPFSEAEARYSPLTITAAAAETDDLYTETPYYIRTSLGTYLTVHGTDDGATLTCDKYSGSTNQQFTLEVKNNRIMIKSVYSNKYIEVHGFQTEDWSICGMYSDCDQSTAEWYIERVSTGKFALRNAYASNKYLNVRGGSSDSGTNVQIYGFNNNDISCIFSFEEVSSSNSGSSNQNQTQSQAEKFVEFAKGEIGEQERTVGSDNIKYNDFIYGHSVNNTYSGQWAWCVAYISYVSYMSGTPSSVVPHDEINVPHMRNSLKNLGGTVHTDLSSYTPQTGDIIFLNDYNHIGIVDYTDTEGSTVYYIDGNNISMSPHGVHYSSINRYSNSIEMVITPKWSDGGTQTQKKNNSNSGNVSWPSINTIKVYPEKTVNAYNSSGNKIGSIWRTDMVTVYSVGDSCYVSYPLDSGGSKSGYINYSDVFSGSLTAKRTASSTFNVYRHSNGDSNIGEVWSGDPVYIFESSGSYTQIMYPVGSSSSGAWKLGWVSTDTLNRCTY